MAEEKKGIYHSELRKAGPVRVTVEHEAQESTKKKGSWYVTLKIDGRTRYYSPENQACLDFFNGTKGKTFTLVADGGGKGQEDTATIEYVGEGVSEAQPRPTAKPAARPPAARGPAAPRRGPAPHNTSVPPGHPDYKPSGPSQRPATPEHKPVFGATVGMAINQAVQFGIAAGELWNPAEIMNRASDLIRISRALEAGNLCPKFSERQASQGDGQ